MTTTTTTTMKQHALSLSAALLAALVTVIVPACGGDDTTDEPVGSSDEFGDAIPSAEMLSLGDEADGTATQGLTLEQAAVGEESPLYGPSHAIREKLNALRVETHERIEELMATGTAQEVTLGNLKCKEWEKDGERAHWKLSACKLDARAERVGFKLEGRPLDSTSDDDYLVVFAGRGVRLPQHEGGRRGAGQVGYNFDNVATLRGDDVGGRLGVGYRAAGRARQLNIALDNVHGPSFEPHSGRYSFKRIVGKGGTFRFVAPLDLVALDENGEPTRGEDGTDEIARASVVWSAEGRARTRSIVCGGTLGERCVHHAQCWTRDGMITFEEESGEVIRPEWDATACPAEADLPEDAPEPPAAADAEPPAATDDETGAPLPEEPAASAQE